MIKNKTIPCYLHPTQIILVDDNISFLNNMSLNMDEANNCKTFAKPQIALEYIHANYKSNNFLQQWLHNVVDYEPEEVKIGNFVVDIDTHGIHQKIYDPNRFDELAIIIVDYRMPVMNGIDFFHNLSDYPVKKLLITGYSDYNIAIDAFNNGVIDKFIEKDVSSFFTQINATITLLQQQYFQTISELITNNLLTCSNCCLYNPAFVELFNKVINDYNIIEHYLLDNTGSFLLLDSNSNPVWLLVKSIAEIADLQDIAESCEADTKLITALANRTHFPYFFTQEELLDPVTSWQHYMYPATLISGTEDYYYTIVTGDKRNVLQQKNILSYTGYLKKTNN